MQNTEETALDIRITCESSEEANATLNGSNRVGTGIVAQLSVSGETPYELWIDGLAPSLGGGGMRYRLSLLTRDQFGSRVTRVTLQFAVVGRSRKAAILGVVALLDIAMLAAFLIVGARQCLARRKLSSMSNAVRCSGASISSGSMSRNASTAENEIVFV